jgi:hypothetical protein
MPPTIIHCHRNIFTELLPGNDKGIHWHQYLFRPYRQTLLWWDMDRTEHVQQFFYYCVYSMPQKRVYLSPCLAPNGALHLTQLLPCNDGRDKHIYRHTREGRDLWGTLLRWAQVPKFHEDWYRHSNVDGRDSQTHRQHVDKISLLLFFRNKFSEELTAYFP